MQTCKRGLAALLLIFAANASPASQFSSDAVGTTTAQFLEIPVSARAVAMGSAQGAVVNDASAMYYDPAGLAGIENASLTFTHAFYFQSVNYDYAALAKRFGDIVMGVQVQYLSPGAIDEVDNTGIGTGNSFQPQDMAVGLGAGLSLDMLDIGAVCKYISSSIIENASTTAVDLGTRLRISDIFALSLSAANLGKGLKYRETEESLPESFRFGSVLRISALTLAADAIAPKGAAVYYAAGTEYVFGSRKIPIAARAGYNSRTSQSKLGGMTGFSAGGGISLDRASLDYAWSPFGDLGSVHRISFGYKWE